MDRRQFLAGCGALAAGATAGCLGAVPGLGDGGGIDTSSPETAVNSYVNLLENPTDISEEDVEKLFHSEVVSQYQNGLGSAGSGQTDGSLDISVTDVQGPNVVSEDVSARQIRETLQSGMSGGAGQGSQANTLDDAFIDDLGASETALVDVSFTYNSEYENPQSGETQSFEVTTAQRVIVSREGGEWKIVAPITRNIETGTGE